MSLRTLSLSLPLLALAALGCGSSRTASGSSGPLDRAAIERSSSPLYESLNPQFNVVPAPGGGYTFIFSAGASGTSDSPDMRALRSINSVTFTVYAPDGRAYDSLTTNDVPTSGVQNSGGGASLTATASAEWRPSDAPPPGTRVIARAYATDGVIVRMAEVPPLPPTATTRRDRLILELDVEERGGMTEFILTVERLAPPMPDEYLPSGERYRIELFDQGGQRVWSSSSGQMYTQALGPVVPEKVGERVVYRAMFDGMSDETHARLEPGRYRIVATVPAQPRPYVIREELTWSK
jgi:hypothetical protein